MAQPPPPGAAPAPGPAAPQTWGQRLKAKFNENRTSVVLVALGALMAIAAIGMLIGGVGGHVGIVMLIAGVGMAAAPLLLHLYNKYVTGKRERATQFFQDYEPLPAFRPRREIADAEGHKEGRDFFKASDLDVFLKTGQQVVVKTKDERWVTAWIEGVGTAGGNDLEGEDADNPSKYERVWYQALGGQLLNPREVRVYSRAALEQVLPIEMQEAEGDEAQAAEAPPVHKTWKEAQPLDALPQGEGLVPVAVTIRWEQRVLPQPGAAVVWYESEYTKKYARCVVRKVEGDKIYVNLIKYHNEDDPEDVIVRKMPNPRKLADIFFAPPLPEEEG